MLREGTKRAHPLAREPEAVFRHYLSNGKREGRYWLVGDVHNSPGRSMFVRLQDSPKGPAGKWTDAATGEHGDLLDVIRESLGLRDFRSCPAPNRKSPRNMLVRQHPLDRKRLQDGSLRSRTRLRAPSSRHTCG